MYITVVQSREDKSIDSVFWHPAEKTGGLTLLLFLRLLRQMVVEVMF